MSSTPAFYLIITQHILLCITLQDNSSSIKTSHSTSCFICPNRITTSMQTSHGTSCLVCPDRITTVHHIVQLALWKTTHHIAQPTLWITTIHLCKTQEDNSVSLGWNFRIIIKIAQKNRGVSFRSYCSKYTYSTSFLLLL